MEHKSFEQNDELSSSMEELKRLESENENDTEMVKPSSYETPQTPNILDGWQVLDVDQLPYDGIFYPKSWRFAYRCPTVKEVARFSTTPDTDTPAILAALDDMVRKCVKIYDTDTQEEISSLEINKGDKMFFLLKIRDYYLPDNPIQYGAVCDNCHEEFMATLYAKDLIFPDVKDGLIEAFNGRQFSLDLGLEEPILFHITTIGIYSKIFNFILKAHRDKDKSNARKDNIIHDKLFLTIAPFLFIEGNETVDNIIKRFKDIIKNDKLLNAYTYIANNLKIDNLEEIGQICSKCSAEVTTEIRFPEGLSKLFSTVNISDNKYF